MVGVAYPYYGCGFVARLRTKWSDALSNRREFLDTEVRKIMEKRSRNESDTVKENELIDQWTMLQVRTRRIIIIIIIIIIITIIITISGREWLWYNLKQVLVYLVLLPTGNWPLEWKQKYLLYS